MSVPDDPRSRELLEHGRGDLERRFDPALNLVRYHTELGTWHDPRDSLWYALCLLIDGEPRTAERIIRQVIGMQERHESDPHHGNFRWLYEDEIVTDLNAVEFLLEGLVHILQRAAGRLSDETKREIFDCMRLAFEEVDRLDVHWTYTNIYLLDVMNSILGGEILADARIRERGLQRLRGWAEHTRARGCPHEFNSPTYSAVQITALAALGQFAQDADARALALEMEQFLWRHVARHFHPPTLQLAGPHSRAYRHDVTGAAGFLKVVLYRLLGEPRLLAQTPYYSGPGREGDVLVALTEYHCPPDALAMFRQAETREVREAPSREIGVETVTYLTPEFALGTMSYPYGVGDPPEPWPQHNSCILHYVRDREPGYGVLYCRYLMNEGGPFGSAHESGRTAVDRWDLGVFRTAQRRGDAVIAYGALPYLLFPVSSLRLDVRLLGPDAGSEIVVADQPYRQDEPLTVPPGAPVGVADGGVHRAESASADAARPRGADPPLARRQGDGAIHLQLSGPGQGLLGVPNAGGALLQGQRVQRLCAEGGAPRGLRLPGGLPRCPGPDASLRRGGRRPSPHRPRRGSDRPRTGVRSAGRAAAASDTPAALRPVRRR